MYQKTDPLWKIVYQEICDDIGNQRFKEGEYLPNENDLAVLYNVSRITIRTALAKLSDDGLIKRTKGKGTLVLGSKIGEPLYKIKGFTEEMRQKGLVVGTDYAKFSKKCVSVYVAELFNCNLSTKFNVIERVRSINDTNVGYFVSYIAPDVCLPKDNKLYYGSLYKLMEDEGIVVNKIRQTISAEIVDKNTQKMLQMVKGEPVIVMKRFGYMGDRLVEYSVCKYDARRYEYQMEINAVKEEKNG